MSEIARDKQQEIATTAGVGSLGSVTDEVPFEWYDRLRQRGDIVWDEEREAWLVLSYALLREMWRNDEVIWHPPFVHDPEYPLFGMTREEWTEFIGPGELGMSLHVGPTYARMHRWWFQTFSPRVLAHWGETLIEPIANAKLDELVARGRIELGTEYADFVATRVMIAVLGLPWDDDEWIERFFDLHHDFRALNAFQQEKSAPRAKVEAGLAAVRAIQAMFEPSVLARRSGEGTDFISQLWRDGAELFGTGDFGTKDVMAHVITAFNAGTDAVAGQAANALYLVLSQPGLQDAVLAAGDEGCRRVGEESLRLYSVASWRQRRARQDTELGGVAVKKGDLVIGLNGAGSTDPAHYACPYDVDLNRPSPRDHFGFGWGSRLCAGQALARFALERILTVALQRLPDLHLDPDADPPQLRGNVVRAWTPLHAVFTPT
jgi:cytochrome P450